MNTLSKNASTVALILSCAATLSAEDNRSKRDRPPAAVNVRVFNYAGVRSHDLTKAQKEAARIFRESGIETNWIECSLPGPDAQSNPRCTAKTEATDLVVRLVPKAAGFENHAEFGVAMIPSDGGFGKYATIFYDRVAGYAERWHASEGLLLGHLVAHELGHLLLGANSHSGSGIMNVPWSRKKIERANLGTLLFTDQEAKRMQTLVAERIALKADSRRAGN